MRFYRLVFPAVLALAMAKIFVVPAFAADLPTLQTDDRVLGNANAPITIFEYFSLTCPHCAAFASETLPQVRREWIDTGKVKLVYRDYPLDRDAALAAQIARCFPEDRYFGFIDILLTRQRDWVFADMAPTRTALEHLAATNGMSQQQFDACANNQKISDAVLKMRLEGQNRYGVHRTPTFFINGSVVEGEEPYGEFVKHLEAASAGQH